jgi:hypothetical protein
MQKSTRLSIPAENFATHFQIGKHKARLEPEELKLAAHWYQLQSKNPCFCLSFFLPAHPSERSFSDLALDSLSRLDALRKWRRRKGQSHNMKLSPRGFLARAEN